MPPPGAFPTGTHGRGRPMMIVRNVVEASANWLVALAIVWVIGDLVVHSVLRRVADDLAPVLTLWIGLATALMLSLVAHVFVGLDNVGVQVVLLGLFALAVGRGWRRARAGVTRARRGWSATDASTRALVVGAAATAGVGLLVLVRACFAPVANYDSYLYHLASVDYWADGKVVVGLANLHSRFGFQTTIHPLSALFDNGSWGHNGFRLANGFVVLLAGSEWLARAVRWRAGHRGPADVAILVAVPVLVTFGLTRADQFVSTASPDLGAALVTLVAVGWLIDVLVTPTPGHLVGAVVLSALAASLRPINFLLVGTSIGVAWWTAGRRPTGSRPFALRAAAPGFALVVAGWVHSTLLTGFPIYPTPVHLKLFPWAVSARVNRGDLRSIEAWAKRPGAPTDEVLGNWRWLGAWWRRAEQQCTVWLVLFGISVAVLVLAAGVGRLRWSWPRAWAALICTLPLAVWFLKAPEVRFGLGQLAAASMAPWCFVDLDPPTIRRRGVGWSWVLAALVLVGCAAEANGPGVSVRTRAFFVGGLGDPPRSLRVHEFAVVVATDTGGVSILQPVAGDQCGRVRWCTPYPRGVEVDHHAGWTVVTGAEGPDPVPTGRAARRRPAS